MSHFSSRPDLYEGMVEYCDREQDSLKSAIKGHTLGKLSAQGRRQTLNTTLEDLEHCCRVAGQRGWSKAQVASQLRAAGAKWSGGKLVSCPDLTRGWLATRLTVGQP